METAVDLLYSVRRKHGDFCKTSVELLYSVWRQHGDFCRTAVFCVEKM
jgi:hypothetical protein